MNINASTIGKRCGQARSASRTMFAIAALSVALFAQAASAASRQPKINPPPSAELTYSIKAQQSGINVKGDAVLRWNNAGNRYEIVTETNAAMFGKILGTRSEGSIGTTGLIPERFSEQRYRKRETVIQFDRAAGTISFSESGNNAPMQSGVQDKASVVWQLISLARAAPASFKSGLEWTFPVVGRRQVEPWTFKVIRTETIQTPLGAMQALHVQKTSDSHRDQDIDLWLAPSMQWYPVKLRYSDSGGLMIEQTLKSMK